MLPEVFLIACFLTMNPSPFELVVSGSPAAIDALTREIEKIPGARTVDRALGKEWAFARFEAPADLRYGDYMAVYNVRASYGLLGSDFKQRVTICPEPSEDPDDLRYTKPTGVFGRAAELDRARAAAPWAQFSPVALADGRQGVMFTPEDKDDAEYRNFILKAREGAFGDVEIGLLEPDRN